MTIAFVALAPPESRQLANCTPHPLGLNGPIATETIRTNVQYLSWDDTIRFESFLRSAVYFPHLYKLVHRNETIRRCKSLAEHPPNSFLAQQANRQSASETCHSSLPAHESFQAKAARPHVPVQGEALAVVRPRCLTIDPSDRRPVHPNAVRWNHVEDRIVAPDDAVPIGKANPVFRQEV